MIILLFNSCSKTLNVLNRALNRASIAIDSDVPHYLANGTNSFFLDGDCSNGDSIIFTGDISGSTACTSNRFSFLVDATSLSDGNYDITLTLVANTGKNTTSTFNFTKDWVAPVISFLTSPGTIVNTNTSDFTLLISESTSGVEETLCNLDSAGYTACSSAINLTALSSDDHTLQIKTLDVAGNESNILSYNWTVDLVNPSLSVTAPPLSVQGAEDYEIQWTLTEENVSVSSTFTLEYSTNGGLNWNIISNSVLAANGPLTNEAFSYTWAVPNLNSTTVKIKISFVDESGRSVTHESSNFKVDSIAPVAASILINGGIDDAAGSTLSIATSASDTAPGTLSQYQLSIDSGFAGSTWKNYPVQSTYAFPFVNQSNTLYFRVKDAAGNISNTVSDTIDLDIGEPPLVNILNPTSSLSLTTQNQTIDLQWKIETSSGNALTSDAISISYSLDDGVTTTAWPGASNLSPLANGGCTLVLNATGCATLLLPLALENLNFQIIVYARDSIGATGLASTIKMNGPAGLQLVAGRNSVALGASALARAGMGYILARDPTNGDIYVGKDCEILKINSLTGVVERWAGLPGSCSPVAGGAPADSRFQFVQGYFNESNSIRVDENQNVYWSASGRIYFYNKLTNLVSFYAGDINGSSFSSADGTPIDQFSGDIEQFFVGKNNTFYFTVRTGTFTSTFYGYNCSTLYKIQSDQTVLRIAGDPTKSTCDNVGLSGNENPLTITPIGYSLIPGGTSTEDVFVLIGGEYANFSLYKMSEGSPITFFTTPTPRYKMQISPYISSRNEFILAGGGSGVTGYTFINATTGTESASLSGFDSLNTAMSGMDSDSEGGIYYTGEKGRVISYLDASNNRSTFAGVLPNAGNGGLAIEAEIRDPKQITLQNDGNIYFSDEANNSIRKITPTGTIDSFSVADPYAYAVVIKAGDGSDFFWRSTYISPAGITDISNTCVYFCNSSNPSFASTENSSNPLSLGQGTYLTNPTVKFFSMFQESDNLYIWAQEYDDSSPSYRSFIKKIDLVTDEMTTIAGSNSLPFAPLSNLDISGFEPTTISPGFNASINRNTLSVVANIIYLQQYDSLYTLDQGATTPTWVKQLDGASPISMTSFTTDSTGRIFYTIGSQLYYKDYVSDGSGSATLIDDFSGIITNPIVWSVGSSSNSLLIAPQSTGSQIYQLNFTP